MLKKIGIVVGALLGVLLLGACGLVGYAALTVDDMLHFPDTPMPAIEASDDPAIIEQGRYLVHGPAHCAQCHSTSDRAHPELIATAPLKGGLEFAMGPLGVRYGRNLTPDRDTGIGALSDGEVARAVRAGVTHEGDLSFFMRYSAATPSDEDLRAIISYLRSLEPVRNEVPPGEWYVVGKSLLAYVFPKMEPRTEAAPTHAPATDEPTVARGAYLADHVMLCTACHTAWDMSTFEIVGPKGGGGLPEPSHGEDSDMEFVAPNLTSHATGVTGQLDEDAFVARLRAGRTHLSSIMPWENFAATSESDLRSVYRYLRSLPPVDEDSGPTYREIGWTAPE